MTSLYYRQDNRSLSISTSFSMISCYTVINLIISIRYKNFWQHQCIPSSVRYDYNHCSIYVIWTLQMQSYFSLYISFHLLLPPSFPILLPTDAQRCYACQFPNFYGSISTQATTTTAATTTTTATNQTCPIHSYKNNSRCSR